MLLEKLPVDEIFDIVDERDRVIGQRPRSEVHRLGLLHRAVHILVRNRNGEFFLQKRSMSKDTHPGAWDSSSAGHLEAGEGYDEAAVRELEEELGLSPAAAGPIQYLFKLDASPTTDEEFLHVYRIENEGPFTLQASEIECGDWFSADKITQWIAENPGDFPPAFMLVWKIYNERYTQ